MICSEPSVKVALGQNCREYEMTISGSYRLPDGQKIAGTIGVHSYSGQLILSDAEGKKIFGQETINLAAAAKNSTFTLDVKIGLNFHWQRLQTQTFCGDVIIQPNADSSFNLINKIPLEDYIACVISSEMSASAPLEFLKAQAITARSWLVAMLERKKSGHGAFQTETLEDGAIIRWRDTNDHLGFDVCADDHCQRYQGIATIKSAQVENAVESTRGVYLVSDHKICDARYFKACGGRTEIFSTAWENASYPYLQSIADSAEEIQPACDEKEAAFFLLSRPVAYCDVQDRELLCRILPSFDQETLNFYRWRVVYTREELEKIIHDKSGIDFGKLRRLTPIARGLSGRISKLKIEGAKRSVVVGKELEIRRWLSPSHLLSSAFVVSEERSGNGDVERFILDGGGWGHGVGLCQIGAALMAHKGFDAKDILAHYFPGARLQKLY